MEPVFTTAVVPKAQKVDLWRDFISRSFAPIETSEYGEEHFEAQVAAAPLGELELSHFTGTGHCLSRPRRVIKSSDADIFVAVVQLSGTMSFEHGIADGNDLSGSVLLLDMTQEHRAMFHRRIDMVDVSIPRRRIETLLGSTRNLAGLTLGPDQPMTGLIIDFFRRQTQVANKLSAGSASRLGAIGADLLAAGFLEKLGEEPSRSSTSAAVTARAKAFIRSKLAQSNLTAELVAASQNLSLRRLQELFAEEQVTISDYIWEQRLLRAKSLLESAGFERLSVADIATAAGFVSLPHFSRRFRARFDCTAGEWRRHARSGSRLLSCTEI